MHQVGTSSLLIYMMHESNSILRINNIQCITLVIIVWSKYIYIYIIHERSVVLRISKNRPFTVEVYKKTRLAGCIPFRITRIVHKNSLQPCILVGHSCSENCKISPFEKEREEEQMQSESGYGRLSVNQFTVVLSSSFGL